MAHLPVLSDSHHFMYQLIPTGYDQYTDKMMKDGVYSYRVGQMALMPLVSKCRAEQCFVNGPGCRGGLLAS